MGHNIALANAARKVRALSDRLPDDHYPDISECWHDLLDRIGDRDGEAARRIIHAWTEEMEVRLSGTLLNAPGWEQR